MHDLTVDLLAHRAYQTLHGIHHAEHTGNLGIAELEEAMDEEVELEQVLAISRPIPGCVPPLDESGLPVVPEPHVHGVQVDPKTGTAYVSDEGEDCFYESVTILEP